MKLPPEQFDLLGGEFKDAFGIRELRLMLRAELRKNLEDIVHQESRAGSDRGTHFLGREGRLGQGPVDRGTIVSTREPEASGCSRQDTGVAQEERFFPNSCVS